MNIFNIAEEIPFLDSNRGLDLVKIYEILYKFFHVSRIQITLPATRIYLYEIINVMRT